MGIRKARGVSIMQAGLRVSLFQDNYFKGVHCVKLGDEPRALLTFKFFWAHTTGHLVEQQQGADLAGEV